MSLSPAGWTRQDLAVAAPPLVVVGGSLLSALWQGMGLPGSDLLFPPPTLLAAALVITGALMGLTGNPLLRHPSWFIFALSALSFLSVAALASREAAGAEGASASGLPLGLVVRVVWLGVAMALAIRMGQVNTRRVLLLFALFLAGEVSRFPVLQVNGGEGGGPGFSVLVVLAAVMVAESAVVAWVVVAFSRGVEGAAFGVLLALLLAHPLLTTWQVTLTEPGGIVAYVQTAIAAAVSLGLLMALAFALHRLTVGMSRRVR